MIKYDRKTWSAHDPDALLSSSDASEAVERVHPREDVLQLTHVRDGTIVDLGFYGSDESTGTWVVVLVRNSNWDQPVVRQEHRDFVEALSSVELLVTNYASNDAESFEGWWRTRFGKTLPMGHELRRELPGRWLRIHSLPGRKRYADSEAEYQEILRRQRAVAGEVLDEDPAPFVAVPLYVEDLEEAPALQSFDEFPDTTFKRCMHFREEPDGRIPGAQFGYFVVYVGTEAPFTAPLRAIADDELRAVWVSTETEEIFAPYDGGVDLIVRSPARVAELRAKFSNWLSPRADGL